MRVEKVLTNLTCNQNCTYCTSRLPAEDPKFVSVPAVRRRIDAAIAAGAREVVLTGGEPLLRNDFADLVTYARSAGAERVVLETNATLVDASRARALAEAGLSGVRVNLAGVGDALDDVTRDPGGYARTLAGLQAFAVAKLPIEIAVAVVRATVPLLTRLPSALVELLGERAVRAILVTVPTASPDAAELVSYEDAAGAIAVLDAAARAVGIPVRMSPGSGPPPCVMPSRSRSAHMFTLTRGGAKRDDHSRIEACTSCDVADRCAGMPTAYLARWPTPAARPITGDRLRRRLSVISSIEEQVTRELVTASRSSDPVRGDIEDHVVRVNFHCNQTCRFCFVSTHLPAPDEAAVREAIVEAGRRGARIVLSGGEPTLNPKLGDYVRLAKAHSAMPVELQTNAVLLESNELTRALVEAGLDQAFVSLHGCTADVSDEVTGAPGTFARTVRGIDNLARTPVVVILNFVMCQANYHQLVEFVELAAARWKGASVNLSFVAPSTDVVPRDRALIPRYSDVLPFVAAALARGRELGVAITGFESMCGVPLCLVPADLERYFDMSLIPAGFDGGEFVRTAACTDCALDGRCYGLRRGYEELYGADELRPVARSGGALAAPRTTGGP